MLADVIFVVWLVMAAALGWNRRFRQESASLLWLVATYLFTRFVAHYLAPPLAAALEIGPVTLRVILIMALWALTYMGCWRFWKWWRSRPGRAGIRIDVDEEGKPIVRGGQIQAPLGAVIGVIRGLLLYVGVVACLIPLVPAVSFKDGRGMAMVHPKSRTMKYVRRLDPELRRMEMVTRGLRSLRYLKRSSRARRKARRNPQLKKILKMPALRALQKNRKLLHRANLVRQGRRDSTLLLWMPLFQKTVVDPSLSLALATLARRLPAPTDQHKK